MEWMTQAEFARKEGVSRMAICHAIRSGRLRTNGKSGKACRIQSCCTLASSRTNIPANLKYANSGDGQKADPMQTTDYHEARTQKLLAEIEAANFRNESKYNEMLRQVSEKQLELFSAAFAPVKDKLIELNLEASQFSELQKKFETAMEGYRQAVTDWNNSLMG